MRIGGPDVILNFAFLWCFVLVKTVKNKRTAHTLTRVQGIERKKKCPSIEKNHHFENASNKRRPKSESERKEDEQTLETDLDGIHLELMW